MRALAWAGLALACATQQAGAEPATYVLDPAHSVVQFELLHFGTSTIRGRFQPLSGTVTLDPQAGRGEVGLQINTASVSTGLRVFDARIREADLLDAEAFPTAYFVATRFTFDGDRIKELRGEFTLRGISQPLTLRAQRYGCRNLPAGPLCGGDFEGEFDRDAFGITFGLPFVGNRVRLLVQAEGLRQ